MSFRLRRGTNTERQSVVFAEGELVYTTDTQELYVGDGATLGGIKITGSVEVSPIALTRNLDLNTFDIVGAGDISISGMVSATAFHGNGAGLTNLPLLDVNNGATYQISIMGADSSIIVNSDTSEVHADVFGSLSGVDNTLIVDGSNNTINASFLTGTANINVVGNTTGSHIGSTVGDHTGMSTGFHRGDVEGSVYMFNSTLLIDAEKGNIIPNKIISGGLLKVIPETGINQNYFELVAIEEQAFLRLTRSSQSDLVNLPLVYGTILFDRSDSNGMKTTSIIAGAEDGVFIASNKTGDFSIESMYTSITTDGLGVGTYTPAYKLDVRGDAGVTGAFTFGSISTTTRDALTPANGMVIYNTTANRFQGYQNGGWINLDDGTSAP